MRVPRREHRSVAFPPLAGTCLTAGLGSLVLCDEAVLPGVRLPSEPRQAMFLLTVRGQQIYRGAERTIRCLPGSLVAMAGGSRWAAEVDGDRAHHALLVSGTGAWFSRMELDLAPAGGVLTDPAPPAAVVGAMQTMVAQGIARPAGWDWAVLAAFGQVASHVGSLSQRGGGTMSDRLGRLVDGAPAEAWRLADAAKALAMGEASLIHHFRAETGEGPASWIRRRRMDHARRLLLAGQRPKDVAAALGFADLARFSRCYRTTMGVWPSAVARPESITAG